MLILVAVLATAILVLRTISPARGSVDEGVLPNPA